MVACHYQMFIQRNLKNLLTKQMSYKNKDSYKTISEVVEILNKNNLKNYENSTRRYQQYPPGAYPHGRIPPRAGSGGG